MKLTIDTEKKLVTIHEQVAFKQIDQVKKLIGEDWKDWSFHFDGAERIVYRDNWWHYPSYPNTLTFPSYPSTFCTADVNAPATCDASSYVVKFHAE